MPHDKKLKLLAWLLAVWLFVAALLLFVSWVGTGVCESNEACANADDGLVVSSVMLFVAALSLLLTLKRLRATRKNAHRS